MRWFEAALAARRVTRRLERRQVGAAALAAAAFLALAGAGAAAPNAPTVPNARSGVFTGYGFESCNAPSIDELTAWLASPYRAVGIYIGGASRSCANAELNAAWVASALAGGWSLIPTYVGLQAPCVSSSTRKSRFTAANAQSQGTAAAADAIAQATLLGLPAGSPIYFDMEAYSVNDAACTKAVQTFISAWVAQLHARGYVAGVYGSAASTGRDMQALAGTPGGPDAMWIANWNGSESVFGDPYVSDTLWTNHQRIHQYRGGHKETWGGVTINIDNDYVDGPVVTGAPVPVTPPVNPSGTLTTADGMATANWPPEAVDDDTSIQLDPSVPGVTLPGYGTGGYGVALLANSYSTLKPVRAFAAPVTLTFQPRTGKLAPVYSTNGTVWKHVPQLVGDAIGPGARTGWTRGDDRGFVIQTTVAGWFALVPDGIPPAAPGNVSARFVGGELALSWSPALDRNGPIAGYLVTRTNATVAELPRRVHSQRVSDFHPRAPSVYRVVAVDVAGNESRPSKAIVVLPSKRPTKLPKAIPAWAWRLAAWDHHGVRPNAPKQVPEWYWRWAKWQALPFHLRGQ